MNLGFLHLHARKRMAKSEPFPSRAGFKRLLDYVILIVAFITPLILVPQVYAIYTTHDVQGLVLFTWAMFAVMNLVWILYGIVHRTFPIIVTYSSLFVLNSAVVVAICMYR